jgi:hypothetical protein
MPCLVRCGRCAPFPASFNVGLGYQRKGCIAGNGQNLLKDIIALPSGRFG